MCSVTQLCTTIVSTCSTECTAVQAGACSQPVRCYLTQILCLMSAGLLALLP
jgi:hypothetical protein